MSLQIMNGGMELAILKLAKEDGNTLSPEDQARLEYLESLPRDVWIDLDENGMMITPEEAQKREEEKISHYSILK